MKNACGRCGSSPHPRQVSKSLMRVSLRPGWSGYDSAAISYSAGTRSGRSARVTTGSPGGPGSGAAATSSSERR